MPSRQELAEELFEAALALKRTERSAFLSKACTADPELGRMVEELLAGDALAGSFLEHPPLDFLDRVMTSTAPPAGTTYSLDGSGMFSTGSSRLRPGEILIDRFVIVRFIAKGGMGEVYEAEDRFLQNTHVALKTILPDKAGDPALRVRFEREVLHARGVVHPNLCPIYDIFHCEQPPPSSLFLTMKLLPGQTLAARLRAVNQISIEEGLAIQRQIVAGMVAIHVAGVIHRDIKPNNIMLDGSGRDVRLWITDFGLARAFETETTSLGRWAIIGTPAYMAPELFRGQPPSRASDLFALGVVLHEVFTGFYRPGDRRALARDAKGLSGLGSTICNEGWIPDFTQTRALSTATSRERGSLSIRIRMRTTSASRLSRYRWGFLPSSSWAAWSDPKRRFVCR